MTDEPVRYARAPGVLDRRVLDGVLVLPRRGDGAVALLGSASAIWDLLAEPASSGDLVAALAEHFEGEIDQIAQGVAEALDTLVDLGLAVPVPPT